MRPPLRLRDPVGWVVAGATAVGLTAFAWVRHRNGWSGALDLGIFDQGVWLLSEGRAPEVTVNGRSLFADHLSPILLVFVPFYVVAPSPFWLLAGQSIAIAVGVPAARALARSHGVHAAPVTLAYLLSGPLLAAAFFDFHPWTMGAGPLLWLLVALRGERRDPVVLAVLLTLLCRTDLGWVVAALALVAPRRHRPTLLAFGVVGFAFAVVVPALLGFEGRFAVQYGHIADSPGELFTHPWRVLTGFSLADAETVFLWFMSTGLLIVLAPRWAAMTVVAALPILLSQWPGTEERFFHYGAPMVPLLLGGAIVAATRITKARAVQALVLGAAASAAFSSPLLVTAPRQHRLWEFVHSRFGDDLPNAIDLVDDDEPISVAEPLVPHLSHRRVVYGFPLPFHEVTFPLLFGRADPDVAATIDVVVVEEEDRAAVEALGFEVEEVGAGLIVGRR